MTAGVRSARVILLTVSLAVLVAAVSFVGWAGTEPSRGGTLRGYRALDATPKIQFRRGQVLPGFTGGPYTAPTGETLSVYGADEYLAADPAVNQRWADFLGGLLHGPELGDLTLYIAPLARVRRVCGAGALGCYDGGSQTIVAIGDDLRGVTAQSVLSHEYGHHIANNRRNDPWEAIDFGTKRWASYVNVCNRAESGELVPGDEGEFYKLNPGELFAETYRVLSERRAGLPESQWEVVGPGLYPDDQALAALEQDVVEPWTGNTATTVVGSFGPRATGRGYRLPTAYDGVFRVTLREPSATAFALRVVDPANGKVLVERAGAQRTKTLRVAICGQRTLQVQVKRISGWGLYTLQISKP